ncbi:MAG: serine O-acetyltransferase, partial [Clostridia bacterium]|nr:serine O-acetyltransferase [Clostridia bacterium]
DVPENCTAVGIPAHIVRRGGVKPEEKPVIDLDQVHIPDPVENEIRAIIRRIDELETVLAGMKSAD